LTLNSRGLYRQVHGCFFLSTLEAGKPEEPAAWKMDHKISALKLQKRNRQRVNVYLDGEFAFAISRIVAAWLAIDQNISDEKIAQLKEQDAFEASYQQALKFLNYRQRSQTEVRKNLQAHRVPDQVIASVLERLKASGLLNDRDFAKNWVENRAEFHPRGKRALIMELRQRGLEDEDISQAVEELDEEELAYQAVLKQLRKVETDDWQVFRQKMGNFLLRRGFNFDVVSPVLNRVWEEKQASLPDTMD
jgi:regulatory protein